MFIHLEWSAREFESTFKIEALEEDDMVRQGILASSRHPAKGIRRIGLFKVDSAGKRRLLGCCHRTDGCERCNG